MLQEANSLFSVCQRDKELLKDYVAQFKVATLEIYHLDEFVAMMALKCRLLPSHLTYSLDKTPTVLFGDACPHVKVCPWR